MTLLTPTAPTTIASVAPTSRARGGHVHWRGVMQSEWTKMRSVRSTTWSLVVMFALSIGIGILATATEASRWSHASLSDRLLFDPTSLSLTGLLFGQLCIGVLGVIVMSSEYGTGTIRATLAAVPNRSMVLAAKAAVFTTLALVVGEVISFLSFYIGQGFLSGSAPQATLGQPGVLRAVIGGGLYIALLGLFAMGIATIIRHTAGAITAFATVLLILPLISQALPSSINDVIARYLPANIGVVMMTVHAGFRSDAPMFTPWVGLAVLFGYAAAALLIGGWLMSRRDA
ncbi:MAG TPA: ABC transporter permease [Acidimicrobiales bacterium]|jgi:ABC-type transport system involved in multi-copper enzyme maturation permease subunit